MHIKLDEVAECVLLMGKGTQLAKIDIKSAYRVVTIHPSDRPLVGMKWREQIYVDGALRFGLRAAPKSFTAVADALEWILEQNGIRFVMHYRYLDDFLTMEAPDSEECAHNCTNAWRCP